MLALDGAMITRAPRTRRPFGGKKPNVLGKIVEIRRKRRAARATQAKAYRQRTTQAFQLEVCCNTVSQAIAGIFPDFSTINRDPDQSCALYFHSGYASAKDKVRAFDID